MLTCFVELALAGWGIYLLSTGQATMPGGKRVKGSLVRAAGFMFLLPFPLCFVIGFYMGFKEGLKGHHFDIKKNAVTLMMIEMGIIFVCGAVGAAMLWMAGQQPSEPKYRDPERDFSERDFDRIFTAKPMLDDVQVVAPRKEESVLDVVPVAAGASAGVTAQPPPLPRPAAREQPRPRPRDEFDEMPVRPSRAKAERPMNPAVIIAAIALFFVVAFAGFVLMK
jgi:hypothetical protein